MFCFPQLSLLVIFLNRTNYYSSLDEQVSRSHYIKVESDSDSSSGASQPETKGPKLSLSERFGRIAQWSVDRESEHRNLRITAGERLTVEMDSPPSPPYPP